MKTVQNGDTVNVNSQNNWLGFSLSPQMNIGVPSHAYHHHQTHPSSAAAEAVLPSFCHPTSLHNGGFYYGLEGENDGLYNSALPIMPLKSDGSLYEVEALSRTQEQG